MSGHNITVMRRHFALVRQDFYCPSPPPPVSVQYWVMARLCRAFCFQLCSFQETWYDVETDTCCGERAGGPSLSLSECHESPVLHLCVALYDQMLPFIQL